MNDKFLKRVDELREPDFINELGVKWWYENSWHGVKYYLVHKNNYKTRIAIYDRKIIAEAQSLEDIATKIDIFLIKNDIYYELHS